MTDPVYPITPIGSGGISVMAKPDTTVNPVAVFNAIKRRGTTHLVSLLEADEAALLGLQREAFWCDQSGMNFLNYPIADFTLPTHVAEFIAMTAELHRLATAGAQLVVHCRGGSGRSGMTATAVLMHEGYSAQAAIDLVTKARGVKIPDTDEQAQFIHSLESLIL